ncbi:MAG: DNA-binding response regulator [Frankiales bacterium]|jgi:DNA-binding response OmpR family regulator|nr:DNA-binding response regulator [Frankiales bacterium]
MSAPDAAGSRVLLVEDDPDLGRALVGVLAAEGHEVRWAQDASAARALLASATADLILLDLGLPDGDGLDLCREIRTTGDDVVIVVITARTDEADAVRALDGGADDFVLKPFRPVELLARLRAHLRRRTVSATTVIRCGAVRLDQSARRAWVGDVEVALRPKEHELLSVLVASAGTAVRREELMDQVWDEHWSGSTKTLDVHVANVRRKLADAGERWDRISTLRGFGYRFELE